MTDVFLIKDFKMPDGFLWGSSTAGHQIEGNNIHSDKWAEELEKIKSVEDFDLSGAACNHYALYREDADLLKELGHQAYRMSVEWARIEPEQGVYDESALKHYLSELELLKEQGINIFLTLVHFSLPKWFADRGGFLKEENIIYFEKYVEYIVPKITPYVDFWNTLNETNHPRLDSDFKINCLKAHAAAYGIIKKYSAAPVSIAHAFHMYMPKRYFDEFDIAMAKYYDIMVNEYFLHAIRTGEIVFPFTDGLYVPALKNSCDYWALNFYTRDLIDARDPQMISSKYHHTEIRFIERCRYFDEMFAEGMADVMVRLRDRPIYVTENGCCTNDDRFRIVYMAEFLSALREAIGMGADVRGYLYWSFLDNYEWYSFKPRFGMVAVDFQTFKRTPKPSAYFYRDMIKNNGFSQEVLRRYLKESPSLGLAGKKG